MSIVHIDLREGKPASYVQAISDAVHRAMVEYLEVPMRDRFQIIREHTSDHLIYDPHYMDVERTDDIVFVQVTLSTGRSTSQKSAFYARLAQLLHEHPGIRPQDVTIYLVENTREDWSFGNGEAQYISHPKEQWK